MRCIGPCPYHTTRALSLASLRQGRHQPGRATGQPQGPTPLNPAALAPTILRGHCPLPRFVRAGTSRDVRYSRKPRLQGYLYHIWTHLGSRRRSMVGARVAGWCGVGPCGCPVFGLRLSWSLHPITHPTYVAPHNPLSLASLCANRLISDHDVTKLLYANASCAHPLRSHTVYNR